MTEARQLVLRKQQVSDETLAAHVEALSPHLPFAPFQTRLYLAGQGLSSLLSGPKDQLRQVGRVLSELGYPWAIVGAAPRKKVNQVKEFTLAEDRIVFTGRFGERELVRGSRVVAVLTSFKGDLLSRLMRKATVRKGDAVSLSEAEKLQIITTANPILDLYPLPGDLPPQQWPQVKPLRILAGKFNPQSLGERATTSARRNMEIVLDIVREYVGRLHLELDFGLFQMNDCRLELDEGYSAQEKNLRCLSNYGWYLLELHRQNADAPPAVDPVVTAVASTLGLTDEPGDAPTVLDRQSDTIEYTGRVETVADSDFLPPPPAVRKNPWVHNLPLQLLPVSIFFLLYMFAVLSAAVFRNDTMNSLRFWGFDKGVFVFILAGLLFYASFYLLRLKRWMDNTPTSKARSVAMGLVEIKGRAERMYNMLSPITQVPCVYYRLRKYRRRTRVQQWQKRSEWSLVSDISSGSMRFYLRDETGRVGVDPRGANVHSTHKATMRGDMRSLMGGKVHIPENMKFVEEYIPEGASIYVLGNAVSTSAPNLPLRYRVAEKLRLLKQDRGKMMAYDADNDGNINQQEWEAARTDMEHEALADTLRNKENAVPQGEKAVIQKPDIAGLPFVISESTEERLTLKYSIGAAAGFAGAVIAAVIGLLLLLGVLSFSQIPTA